MFRDDNPRCPTCDAALDPAGARLVCNPCNSVFIADAELTNLMNELSPDDERPFGDRLFTGGRLGLTCPRCATNMPSVWIHDTGFERCQTHGSWLTIGHLQQLLSRHANFHAERNRDHSKLEALMIVPVFGALVAIPAQAALLPWIKRRRLRKYLARTTPPKSA